MNRGSLLARINLHLVAFLLLGMCYLGLAWFTGTSSPFLLVRGNSMEPTVHSGDLLVQKSIPIGEIQVGHIIAFKVPAEARDRLKIPTNAVHRVIGIEGTEGELVFVTRGDNSDIDPFKMPSSAVKGVAVKNLGPLGRPILFLTNRAVLLFLGLPVLIFILIVLAAMWLMPAEESEKVPDERAVGLGAEVSSPPTQIDAALSRLASEVAEYGRHLQSHTAVVKNLAETTERLQQAAIQQNETSAELRQAVRQQNEFLADLAEVVKELKVKDRVMSNGKEWTSHADHNGEQSHGTNGNGDDGESSYLYLYAENRWHKDF